MTLFDAKTELLIRRASAGDESAAIEAADVLRNLSSSNPAAVKVRSREIADLLPQSSSARSRLLACSAHAQCYANDFAGAVETLAEAVAGSPPRANPRERGVLYLTQVQPLARLGRLGEAERAARAAFEAFEAAGDDFQTARAAVNIGTVVRMQGRCAEALEWFDRAAPGLGADPAASAMLQSNRAEALLDLDRFEAAGVSFAAALTAFSSLGHQHACAIVEGNLADLDSRAGRIDAAIIRFESAQARYESIGARGDVARLLAEQGEALAAVGAHRKARRVYELAVPVLESAGLAREAVRARIGYAAALARSGDPARAIDELSAAASGAETCGARGLLAHARLAQAETLLSIGRIEDARSAAHEAHRLSDDSPIRASLASVTLAMIALARADAEHARAALAAAAEQSALLAPLRSRIEHVRGLLLERVGDHAGAATALSAAIELAERFRGAIRAEQLRMSFGESSRELYLDTCRVVMAGGASPPEPAVHDCLERMRARTLLEACAWASAPRTQKGGGAVSSDESRLAELNSLYSRIGLGKSSDRDEERWRCRLSELETELEREADRESAGGAEPIIGARPMSIGQVRRALPAQTAIVQYFNDCGSISALVVTRESQSLRRGLASVAELTALRRKLELQVDRTLELGFDRGEKIEALLTRLSAWLVTPLERELTGVSRVVFVPSLELHTLPIAAAASINSRCMHWLTPSATAGLHLASIAEESTTGGATLIVGVVDALAPQMEREATAIGGRIPEASVLVGSDATSDRFLDALPGARVLHLAAHCVFEPDFPMSSRVRLADRWVTAREITGRLRPGAVAVLAGCETGRTAEWSGEDRYGLIRAFLASGASAVIASQWRLHDATAPEIFVDLVERVHRSNQHPAFAASSALADALRRMQQQRIPAAHWAGLFCKGAIV